jgi:hypothetical protein
VSERGTVRTPDGERGEYGTRNPRESIAEFEGEWGEFPSKMAETIR